MVAALAADPRTAPIDASSGEQNRHRLAGRVGASTGPCTSWPSSNCAVTLKAGPITAANSPPARLRWKRFGLSRVACPHVVYKQIVADARRVETGPGDTWAATLTSSAADPN